MKRIRIGLFVPSLALTLTLVVVVLVGCNSSAATTTSSCRPVNSWNGPIFACGAGAAAATNPNSGSVAQPGSGSGSDFDPDADDDIDDIDDVNDAANGDDSFDDDSFDDGSDDGGDIASLGNRTIDTRDAIRFQRGKARLVQDSRTTLRQVAQILNDNPDVRVVRIGVYPDSGRKKDKKLAKKRAQAVRKFLIKEGISGKRLKVKAFKKPGDDRQVVFKIVKRR